jgi:hypothetical protein
MNDCPNADVRDLLPDLVHQRLDAETRARVEAHVASCADCAAELELLRLLRGTLRTPRVDVASIVAAVPAYRAPGRRSWVGWRAAAVITVIVAGASSVAVLQRGVPASAGGRTYTIPAPVPATLPQPAPATTPEVSSIVPKAQGTTPIPDSTPVTHATPVVPAPLVSGAVRELAMGGGAISDLDDRELKSLLKDIESLDAVPSVDVEATPMSPIAPSAPAGP